jgi:hypothetical protein
LVINVQQSDRNRRILIEGLTVDEIVALPDEYIAALVAVGPVVFRVGSAEILGQIRLLPGSLMIELAQIDGGGEGVLPALWLLAERYARQHQLDAVEWVVHAINCARPNLKLRRFLERRGFEVRDVEAIGRAYYFRHQIDESSSGT